MKNSISLRAARTVAFFVAFLLITFGCARAQIISTVAGNGTYGYMGDLAPATAAEIASPTGVAFDSVGNYFFADFGNHCVRKVSVGGIITTICGNGTSGVSGDGGPASAALLYNPCDVAFDAAGNLYIADQNNYRIRKISSTTGYISTYAGGGGTVPTEAGIPATSANIFPAGICLDAAGNVYIADGLRNKVFKITPAGMAYSIAGTGIGGYGGDGGPATAAKLFSPPTVALDAAGNIYIADNGNGCIRKIDGAGNISTVVGTPGTLGYGGDNGPATSAVLNRPNYLIFDASGNMFISDGINNRVRKVNTAGTITTFAGTGVGAFFGDGGPASAAQISYPRGLQIAATGDFYICDAGNNRVRKVTSNNSRPQFIHGSSVSMTICENAAATSMDSLLAIFDADTFQLEKWTLLSPPIHGTAAAVYSTTSTGDTIQPLGLTYTPTTGYNGHDSLKVRISDGYLSDTITVYITINNCLLHVSQPSAPLTTRIWPNPNSGNFSIYVASIVTGDATITVTNLVGEKIQEFKTTTNSQAEISLSVPPGVYFVCTTTAAGKVVEKVVVTQ